MDDQTTVSVSVETVFVAAAEVQFDAVFEPGDLGRREAADGAVEEQLVAFLTVDVADDWGECRRSGFRLVVASDAQVGRSAGLAVMIASHAHVLARVRADQIADFQTGDAHRVPVCDVLLTVFRLQQGESIAEPFNLRFGTGQQAASQLDSRALGYFHVV